MPDRKDVFNKMKAEQKLPTPSKIALEVMRLCNSEDTSLNDIAQLIQLDPALSSEILKYANSSFLSTGIQVVSINKATVKLGMKTVVNLALCFSLVSNNKKGKCESFDYGNFWSNSLAQAISAKTLANLGNKHSPEEVFICALLSHMGELALASYYPQEYATILKTKPSRQLRQKLERDQFGIDSAELTTELFLDWGLPAAFILAAGFHEDLDNVELGQSTTMEIATLLNISFQIALLSHGTKFTNEMLNKLENMVSDLDGVEEDFSGIFNAIVQRWYLWGETFNIHTKQCASYEEIKSKLANNES